jgi:hypothetical protein
LLLLREGERFRSASGRISASFKSPSQAGSGFEVSDGGSVMSDVKPGYELSFIVIND